MCFCGSFVRCSNCIVFIILVSDVALCLPVAIFLLSFVKLRSLCGLIWVVIFFLCSCLALICVCECQLGAIGLFAAVLLSSYVSHWSVLVFPWFCLFELHFGLGSIGLFNNPSIVMKWHKN